MKANEKAVKGNAGVTFGYARVSSTEQNLARQLEGLLEYGVPEENVFCDKMSGKDTDRPQLKLLMGRLRERDTVVVLSLDRLGRNTKDLINMVEELNTRGIRFVSLKEQVDTSTNLGRFFITVMAGLSELERCNIRERQQAGMQIAKREGRLTGRPKANTDGFERVFCKYEKGEINVSDAAKLLGVSRATFYRRIKEYEDKQIIRPKES